MAKKKNEQFKPAKVGRHSKYTNEIAEEICHLISTTSRGLVSICSGEDMPSTVTVYSWLNNPEHKEFLNNYTRAREAQADLLADEIIAIADDGSKDTKIRYDAHGVPYKGEDTEWTSRSRLRVDARKWKASKLAPKKYGDKLDVTTDGDKLPPPVTTLQIEIVKPKED